MDLFTVRYFYVELLFYSILSSSLSAYLHCVKIAGFSANLYYLLQILAIICNSVLQYIINQYAIITDWVSVILI